MFHLTRKSIEEKRLCQDRSLASTGHNLPAKENKNNVNKQYTYTCNTVVRLMGT